MKVYVITAGVYSDYTIYGVAIDPVMAENIRKYVDKEYEEAAIEEFDTETWPDILKTGNIYHVVKYPKGAMNAFKISWDIEGGYAKRNKVRKLSGRLTGLEVTVIARDKEHAIKIAADLFAEYEYRKVENDANSIR